MEQLRKLMATPAYEHLVRVGAVSPIKVSSAPPRSIAQVAPPAALSTQPRRVQFSNGERHDTTGTPIRARDSAVFDARPPQSRDPPRPALRALDYDSTERFSDHSSSSPSDSDLRREDILRTLHMLMPEEPEDSPTHYLHALRRLPRMVHAVSLSPASAPDSAAIAASALLDTGATACFISRHLYETLKPHLTQGDFSRIDDAIRLAAGADITCDTAVFLAVAWIWQGKSYAVR